MQVWQSSFFFPFLCWGAWDSVWITLHTAIYKYDFCEKPPLPLLAPLKPGLNQSSMGIFKPQPFLGSCSLLSSIISLQLIFRCICYKLLSGYTLFNVINLLPLACLDTAQSSQCHYYQPSKNAAEWVIPQEKVCNCPISCYFFSIRKPNFEKSKFTFLG